MSSYKLKLLLTGGPGTEKTELIQRFIKNRFQQNYILTVGVDILTKDVEFKQNEIATLSIWDIGGQLRFEFIRSTFYKGAAGAIIFFDLSRKNSLSEAAKWITEIRSFTNKRIPIVLIGNRISLMETNHVTINKEEIRDIVNKENLMYIETSTNTGNQIDEMFTELTKHIIQQKVE